MKSDITHNSDVKLLVDMFYCKVNQNDLLSPIFNEIAQINWKIHLPRMYSFWSGILFGEPGFRGNPMQKHVALSTITQMGNKEFSEWLSLFQETVDQYFEGTNAEMAKARAINIAGLMRHKIESHEALSI